MKIGIITSLLCALLLSCNQGQNKNSSDNRVVTVPGWKTYSVDSISIQYPGEWSVKKNPQMQALFFLMAPTDSINPDFDANINLIVQDLKGQALDLDKFVDFSMKGFKNYITEDTLTLSKREKDNLGEYQHMINEGVQGTHHLIFEQHLRIIDGKAYILTFTLLKNQWDKYHQVGERILTTLSVK